MASTSPEPAVVDEKQPLGQQAHATIPETGEVLNASGHAQELDRNFSLLSLAAVGINTGNTWTAFGGSIAISIYNGGPPGIIYEFLAVSVFYWCIAALIAELASAMPTSAGVYHWASVTAGPRWGKSVGFFAGWWNCLAWIFGAASMSLILANQVVAMYGIFRPDFVYQRWQVYIAYLLITWSCCAIVLFFNRALPYVQQVGLFLILAGVFVTIVVAAAMPDQHASTDFVWRDWINSTGYTSNGFVFLMGMLNGAYAVGTPDCTSHLAEEIPNPRVNIPKAIAMQMVTGLFTAFFYLIAILYSINDLDAILTSPYTFPLAELYRQATGTRAGAMGLLLVIFLPTVCTLIGCYITSGRMLWTLARDNATPFPTWLRHVSTRFRNPFNATLACGIICTCLGAIYVGSYYAFNAFVGSFIVLSTLSYLAAIAPHYLTKKQYAPPGPFQIKGPLGYVLAAVVSVYMVAFDVIFCFPYAMPVNDVTMNYTCVTTGGFTIFAGIWYLWKRNRGYNGPHVLLGTEGEAAETLKRGNAGAEN